MFDRSAAIVIALVLLAGSLDCGAAPIETKADSSADREVVEMNGQSIAEYVWNDPIVRRPYWENVRTTGGIQVTRNQPPIAGKDRDDHPTMHPGVWLAFGDLNGVDFWRNKGLVRHLEFVEKPNSSGDGRHRCTVKNAWQDGDTVLAIETCRYSIKPEPWGYQLGIDSTFVAGEKGLAFGDQEEMGLGVRVATPLAVINGGEMIDSEGRKNGKEIWGKHADWCEYRGTIDGRNVGMVLVPHPQNFRPSWMHARDYGVLVANPFGQKAFTKGEKSRIDVYSGQGFRLRFGVLVYETKPDQKFDTAAAVKDYLGQ